MSSLVMLSTVMVALALVSTVWFEVVLSLKELPASSLPVTVAVNSTGTSVHKTGPREWQAKIGKIPVVVE